MELLMLVSAIALLQFWGFGLMVGRARGLYDVPAPLTSGHEIFDRWFRVHYNTMERLVILIPHCSLLGISGAVPGSGPRRDLPGWAADLRAPVRERPQIKRVRHANRRASTTGAHAGSAVGAIVHLIW